MDLSDFTLRENGETAQTSGCRPIWIALTSAISAFDAILANFCGLTLAETEMRFLNSGASAEAGWRVTRNPTTGEGPERPILAHRPPSSNAPLATRSAKRRTSRTPHERTSQCNRACDANRAHL